LHVAKLDAHDVEHAPFEQTSPLGHVVPHAPQFALSVASVAQAPLQTVCDAEHVPTHAPFKQASACAHFVPHDPQLSCADVVSTQSPEHVFWPVGQDGAASTEVALSIALLASAVASPEASGAVEAASPDPEHAASTLPKSAQHVERNTDETFMDSGCPARRARKPGTKRKLP
jgi:hypothetical protein